MRQIGLLDSKPIQPIGSGTGDARWCEGQIGRDDDWAKDEKVNGMWNTF